MSQTLRNIKEFGKMEKRERLQTYVPPLIAGWVRDRAHADKVSESIVIARLIFDAWDRETESELGAPATNIER